VYGANVVNDRQVWVVSTGNLFSITKLTYNTQFRQKSTKIDVNMVTVLFY